MKLLKYTLTGISLLLIIFAFDLFKTRKVKLYEEYEIYSERELAGLALL
ncbi:MAG: hypothetical protein IKI40_10230 [Treponema sp.]|nr:hypothetical protein [Treponema sp.]